MTGREFIIYILENRLEDEELFKNGKIPGFMTYEEAAKKFDVGIHTIETWVEFKYLPHIRIGSTCYIPENAELNYVITMAKGGNS